MILNFFSKHKNNILKEFKDLLYKAVGILLIIASLMILLTIFNYP